jgi:hypothetical protein
MVELSTREKELTDRLKLHSNMLEASRNTQSSQEELYSWLKTESSLACDELTKVRVEYDDKKWRGMWK